MNICFELFRPGETEPFRKEFLSQDEAVKIGGLSYDQFAKDYDVGTIKELLSKRPGLLSKKSNVEPDSFAVDNGFESLDDMVQAWLDSGSKAEEIKKVSENIFKEDFSRFIDEARNISFFGDLADAKKKALETISQDIRVVPKTAKGLKRTIDWIRSHP